MNLNFERRTIALNLYGEKYDVKIPSANELDAYLVKLRLVNSGELESSDYDLTKELFESLGLPSEATGQMEMEHMNELSSILLGQKKIQ